MSKIREVAEALVAHGKGILAADESTPTMGSRLHSVGVENGLASRMDYRTGICTAPDLGQYISGVILFEETLQTQVDGDFFFAKYLKDQGIIPGIKVDKGAKPFNAKYPNIEKCTEGLDGLRGSLEGYAAFGAQFAKWRAVINPMPNTFPTAACMQANAQALARYAQLCQEVDIVPIVEPEVLLNNNISIGRCADITKQIIWRTFDEMTKMHVDFRGLVLKPNMVMAGYQSEYPAEIEQVAERTVRCMEDSVPASVPGIAFLSGGQTNENATAHLNAMNMMHDLPWSLTFSYGRALQGPALKAWADTGVEASQEALMHRVKLNSLASMGKFEGE